VKAPAGICFNVSQQSSLIIEGKVAFTLKSML
jgi:hypothetical protein